MQRGRREDARGRGGGRGRRQRASRPPVSFGRGALSGSPPPVLLRRRPRAVQHKMVRRSQQKNSTYVAPCTTQLHAFNQRTTNAFCSLARRRRAGAVACRWGSRQNHRRGQRATAPGHYGRSQVLRVRLRPTLPIITHAVHENRTCTPDSDGIND